MASDQTPIEKARKWYIDHYDLHDLASNGLAQGDKQTIEVLAEYAAHVEAQRSEPGKVLTDEMMNIIKSEIKAADGAIAGGISKDVARGVAWMAIKSRINKLDPSKPMPTVDQVMEVVWAWAMEAKMVSATTEPYYLTNDLRERLNKLMP